MRTKSILSFISLLWLVGVAGCSEDNKELLPDPTLSVSEKALSFGYGEDRQEVVVTTNQAKWFVVTDSKDKEWCVSYTNDNKLSIRVTTNPKEEAREAEIMVVVAGTLSETIKVSQEAAPPIPILTVEGEASFTFAEGTNVLSIITNQPDWSASVDNANRSWCTLTENKTDNKLSIHVTENLGEERTATITLTGGEASPVVFQVLQEGRDAVETTGVDVPAFSGSFVYSVMLDGEKIAEICREYVKEVSETQQTTVAYPVVDGKADLTKGFIATNGGRISWNVDNNTYEYTAGSLTPASKLYIAGTTIRGSGVAVKTATTSAETMKDVEGNVYKIVKVGTQYWMAENLKTVTYNDNTPISGLIGIEDKVGGYLVYESTLEGIAPDKNLRGCLYNFYALPKLAPAGWHVPSRAEWDRLGTIVFGVDGILQKETGWERTFPGMNATGFSAVPSGYCFESGKCLFGNDLSAWWSSTESESNEKQGYYGQVDLMGKYTVEAFAKRSGYSVRLVRN